VVLLPVLLPPLVEVVPVFVPPDETPEPPQAMIVATKMMKVVASATLETFIGLTGIS
jgi:hypothetical protein